YHDDAAATAAEEAFASQFRRGETPETMEERALQPAPTTVADALLALGLTASKGEARRLVAQRGARLNGVTVEDPESGYSPAEGDVWQAGKRRFVRVQLV
ncbi:MAG: tyrosyl-tRNA synthetase, partial [Chloroflexota bacterium]|nr:tyrosyl-tRNA synthetase [Chloroflexota bacterium]